MALPVHYAELSAEGAPTVRFEGSGRLGVLGLTGDGIDGWYSMPAAKVDVTARGQGDGGHDIPLDSVMYASRTVTLHWNANASDRHDVIALTDLIRLYAHRLVRLRVVDDTSDTYCEGGYLTMEQAPAWRPAIIAPSTATIVFERPERLSTSAQLFQVLPLPDIGQGLYYSNKMCTWWTGAPNDSTSVLEITPGSQGLTYPVSYGRPGGDGRNRGVFTNNGTSRAYPTVTVEGIFPQGVRFLLGGRYELAYSQPVNDGGPLVLDFRSRTASVNGRDMSRYLTRRAFPPVPARSSMPIVLGSDGDGIATCTLHDTYM